MTVPLTDEKLGELREAANDHPLEDDFLRLLDEHKALRKERDDLARRSRERGRMFDIVSETAARRLELLEECRRPDRVCPVCLCVDCDDECRLMKELS
jgi:hypothetical protein